MSNVDDQPVVVMTWDGGLFDGMTVAATVSSMAATIAAENFMLRQDSGKPLRGKHIVAVSEVFLSHVDRWNITDSDSRLVRRTVPDFLRLHKKRVMAILTQWIAYVLTEPTPVEADPLVPKVGGESGDAQAVDPDEAIIAAMEARTLTEPGEDEIQVTPDPVVLVDA